MSTPLPAEAEKLLISIPNVIEEDWTGTGYALFLTDRRIVGIKIGGSANLFGSKGSPGVGVLPIVGELAGNRTDPMQKTLEEGKTLDQLLVEKKGSWSAPYSEIEKLKLKNRSYLELEIKSKHKKATYRQIPRDKFEELKTVLPTLPVSGKIELPKR
jgi:hypothetical protein